MARNFQIQYNSRNANTSVVGTTSNYLDVRKYEMTAGRIFSNQEDLAKQRLAVVGPAVLENLGVTDPNTIIGEPIRLRGIQFTVIGVLKSKGQTSPFQNPDDQVLIPINTARFRLMGTDRLRSISVLAPNEDKIPETMADVQRILRREHKTPRERDDDFTIRNQAIGIMNIMLVSVTERTREIGVRKALGATSKNILFQFLIEAVVLCMLGGCIGIAMGTGGAMLLSKVNNWNTAISSQSIMLAFGFSAVVGILFGVWPARRAAKLDPIMALRYE
jgi:putative ABC transport system permease protein